MATKLIIEAPHKVGYVELPIPAELAAGQVLARTVISGISHGTEMTSFLGTSPFIEYDMTPERVFTKKAPGGQSFYPFHWAGYDAVGIVTKIGPGVARFKPGDRIWFPSTHQTEFIFEEKNPDGIVLAKQVPDEEAILINLVSIGLVAVLDAQIKLGDVVVVSGGGTLGQLVTQMAFLNGARRVFMIEPSAPRREFARQRSAVEPIDPSAGTPAAVQIFHADDKTYPDVVIECSGHVGGLAGAIATAGIAGTVVAAGFYAGPASALNLGQEFLHNRVTVKASMGVWNCPTRWPERWDRPRLVREAYNLLAARKLDLGGFVSEKFAFRDAQRAYESIHKDPGKYLKAAFVYS